jgi:hypothetical protein
MTKSNFSMIKHFTEKEIKATGAEIADVDFFTIKKIDWVRMRCGLPITLPKNGITSGKHRSFYHKAGKAVDFYLIQEIHFRQVIKFMLEAGFTGIGLYWNGKIYSYHGDTGNDYRFWKAIKVKKEWVYSELIADPRQK